LENKEIYLLRFSPYLFAQATKNTKALCR